MPALFLVRLGKTVSWFIVYQMLAILIYWRLPASWQDGSIVFVLVYAVIALTVLKFLEPLKIDPAFLGKGAASGPRDDLEASRQQRESRVDHDNGMDAMP